jgi:hypothetical protein
MNMRGEPVAEELSRQNLNVREAKDWSKLRRFRRSGWMRRRFRSAHDPPEMICCFITRSTRYMHGMIEFPTASLACGELSQ